MKNSLTEIEKIKKKKDGLDVLSNLYIYAVFGEKVSDGDLERLKWYGVSQDKTCEEKDLFRLRIPLENGELNIEQLKILSEISKNYANNTLSIAKNQSIRFHHISICSLPNIFNLLKSVNLTTIFAAGHTVRNVITCPVSDIEHEKIADVTLLVSKLNDSFKGNKKFSNMPNKLQFAVSGCNESCCSQKPTDVNFNAVESTKNRVLFSLNIIGQHIGYITSSQVLAVARVIARVYRDYGNREDLEKSSFQYMVEEMGVTKFKDLINGMSNYIIRDFEEIPKKSKALIDHFGINKSNEKNISYIGCKTSNYEVGSEGICVLTELLEKYHASKIKISPLGNLVVLDVPSQNAQELADSLVKSNFNPFI
ncbi:MAG: Sulfite reductase [ferredoxin] [Arcobacter lacus]|nr:MAG: Sulfite reductase [ferredoxin] [Arcobacter lacus]